MMSYLYNLQLLLKTLKFLQDKGKLQKSENLDNKKSILGERKIIYHNTLMAFF